MLKVKINNEWIENVVDIRVDDDSITILSNDFSELLFLMSHELQDIKWVEDEPEESQTIKMSKTSKDGTYLFEWDFECYPGKVIEFVKTDDGKLGYIELDEPEEIEEINPDCADDMDVRYTLLELTKAVNKLVKERACK
jgi:hypothetical protein